MHQVVFTYYTVTPFNDVQHSIYLSMFTLIIFFIKKTYTAMKNVDRYNHRWIYLYLDKQERRTTDASTARNVWRALDRFGGTIFYSDEIFLIIAGILTTSLLKLGDDLFCSSAILQKGEWGTNTNYLAVGGIQC